MEKNNKKREHQIRKKGKKLSKPGMMWECRMNGHWAPDLETTAELELDDPKDRHRGVLCLLYHLGHPAIQLKNRNDRFTGINH